jgi:hypothetical protein
MTIWIDYDQVMDVTLRNQGLEDAYLLLKKKDIKNEDLKSLGEISNAMLDYAFSEIRTLELDCKAKAIASHLIALGIENMTYPNGNTFSLEALVEEFTDELH